MTEVQGSGGRRSPRRRRTSTVIRGSVACLALTCAVTLTAAPAAMAAKRVTFAARVCSSYSQIFANEARNNIMESLKQLGPDTPYPSSTAQMDPVTEAKPPQDACQPLVGWRFTLGTGISPTKLTGVFGSLSQVSDPYDTVISTSTSTDVLGPGGAPVLDAGGHTIPIAGAVTIDLSTAQEEQAAASNLWVMGGTAGPAAPPAAPVGDATKYAFGALRCAVDNLNGDNVEFVSYPSGVDHVYCFAYYVSPPKGSGTIIVKKHITNIPESTPAQTVNFKGNISFANTDPVGHPDDGTFALTSSATVDGTATFVREAGSSWNFREIPNTTLATGAVSCTSAGGPNGHSVIRNPDPNAARPHGVDVDLVDGDVVTCTFTNTFIPPVGLVVRKITRGGFGSFPIDVSGFAPFTLTTSATVNPAEHTLDAQPGSTHTITETLPASDAGTWVAESAACGGSTVAVVRRSRTAQLEVTMPPTGSQVCTFTNRFIPNGVIRIRKVTRGGTASATFYVQPEFGTPTRFVQTATTTAPEVPALARPQSSADATNRLPLGVYSIQELSPFEENGRTWNLVAVVCDGFVPEASSSGAIEVTLTEADPEVDCTFTDELASVPAPLPPLPTPVPVPPVITQLPPPGIQVAGIIERSAPVPQADLVVTKAATPRVVTLGRPVSYLVTVHNRGPATAKDVTLVERQTAITRFLRLQPSKGHCRGAIPRFCAIGSLRTGETATVRVTVTTRRPGAFTNIVAANTSTEVRTLRTMSARARIRVLRAAGARFTG